jgi:hypothetical protein
VGHPDATYTVTKNLTWRCLESWWIWSEQSNNNILHFESSLSCFTYKSFLRPPTTQEWTRFGKYARRMKTLSLSDPLPSQVLSVLQLRVPGKVLLPNLKNFCLSPLVNRESISFIPMFLSPKITFITLNVHESDMDKVILVSTILMLPQLCPHLQGLHLTGLPRDPITTAAVSELLLATNPSTLRTFCVDSPMTEEAREVVCKHPYLRCLGTVIDGPSSLPKLVLPSLTELVIRYNHDHDWLQAFSGASLEKLASISFDSRSGSVGDFLETFERVALTTSIPATISTFVFCTPLPWRPNYRSLLPFTQLKILLINSSCDPFCSSTIDDGIITDLARAMPKLETLHIGDEPCQRPVGVTAKGLFALARHCIRLDDLCIHFQVVGFDPPQTPHLAFSGEPTSQREACALSQLFVGDIRVPEESALVLALTLVRIFPRLETIEYQNDEWEKVANAIYRSKMVVDRSGKGYSFVLRPSNTDDVSP